MSKSRETRTVCVQGVLDVCELLCNKECYFVTVCPFSGLSENPTRVGRGFFTSVGLEVFHVKILCSLFLLIFTSCLVRNNQSKHAS